MTDTTQPRWECPECGAVEYCRTPSDRSPETAKNRLKRRHKGCAGELQYHAGVILGRYTASNAYAHRAGDEQ